MTITQPMVITPRKRMLHLIFLALWLLSASGYAQAQTPRLPTPKNVRVSGTTLSWKAVANASGYELRWRSGGGTWMRATLPASQTRFTIHNLSPNVYIRGAGTRLGTASRGSPPQQLEPPPGPAASAARHGHAYANTHSVAVAITHCDSHPAAARPAGAQQPAPAAERQ